MKRAISCILIAMSLVIGAQPLYAAGSSDEWNQTDEPYVLVYAMEEFNQMLASDGGPTISPFWVIQRDHTVQRTFNLNETVPTSIAVEVQIGRDSATGNWVVAKGTLHRQSLSVGFPTANQQTAIYTGVIQAYLNGDLLPY